MTNWSQKASSIFDLIICITGNRLGVSQHIEAGICVGERWHRCWRRICSLIGVKPYSWTNNDLLGIWPSKTDLCKIFRSLEIYSRQHISKFICKMPTFFKPVLSIFCIELNILEYYRKCQVNCRPHGVNRAIAEIKSPSWDITHINLMRGWTEMFVKFHSIRKLNAFMSGLQVVTKPYHKTDDKVVSKSSRTSELTKFGSVTVGVRQLSTMTIVMFHNYFPLAVSSQNNVYWGYITGMSKLHHAGIWSMD